MRGAYLRICRLLASSGFREQEIAEFAEAVFQTDPRALVDDVAQLRRITMDAPQGRGLDIPSSVALVPTSDVEDKIERLLIRDTGWPRSIAIERLTAVLQSRFPTIIVPSEARKGFRAWIRKLSTVIPEKELLHIATNFRNQMVHDTPSDWRLK